MSVDLDVEGFDVEIRIADLDSLKRHEKFVDSHLEDLEASLDEKGVISDPVIADENSNVILDGMHRVEAISRLGYDKIPVCFLDYQTPEIELRTWWRRFVGLDVETLADIARELGFVIETSTLEEVKRGIENRNLEIYLVSDKDFLRAKSSFDSIFALFESVHSLEERIVEEGFDLSYEPDEDFLESLNSKDSGLLFPQAEKSEVIRISDSGEVLPHKITRHVVPARPLGVDVPLSWLDEDIDEANEKMDRKLEAASLKEISPGAQFRGRKYEEKVVTFEKI